MHAFILAGGFATRLWPLTEKRAKPLLPLAGKPLLSHIVEGIPAEVPVTVSTNDAFAEGFEKWKEKSRRADIRIIVEKTKSDAEKLGALGAVAQWVREANVQDDVLLLTGDNYFGFEMKHFLNRYRPGTPLLAAYDIIDRTKAKAFGTVLLADDKRTIRGFEEKPAEPQTSLVSTGCSILPQDALPTLLDYAAGHPDNVGGIFEELLRKGRSIDCFTFAEPWFDIGSFDAYLEATKALVGNRLLTQGGDMDGGEHEGSVVVGRGSQVTNSTLRDTVVFEGCTIEDCVLERCVIDNGCRLKGIDLTGKMLREGTTLTQ